MEDKQRVTKPVLREFLSENMNLLQTETIEFKQYIDSLNLTQKQSEHFSWWQDFQQRISVLKTDINHALKLNDSTNNIDLNHSQLDLTMPEHSQLNQGENTLLFQKNDLQQNQSQFDHSITTTLRSKQHQQFEHLGIREETVNDLDIINTRTDNILDNSLSQSHLSKIDVINEQDIELQMIEENLNLQNIQSQNNQISIDDDLDL